MARNPVILLSILAVLGLISAASCRSMETQLQGPTRFTRDADEDAQVELVMEKIRHGVTRLRHAEDRIKTFVDKIEAGIENGDLKTLIIQAKEAADGGNSELHKLVDQYTGAEQTPSSFDELIKRISDDTHTLMDRLQGRLDALGNLIKDAQHDASDTSAEDHHKHSDA